MTRHKKRHFVFFSWYNKTSPIPPNIPVMFQQVICLKRTANTSCSQPAQPETSQASLPIFVFSHFSVYSSYFPFLPSPWWFAKHDIITQHLSEGSVTCFALQIKLQFDLQDIPTKLLCWGVESWTVTAVYFCHIHQQDDNHRNQK